MAGGLIYTRDTGARHVYRRAGYNGSIQDDFVWNGVPDCLAWYNGNLYGAAADYAYQCDGFSSNVINSFTYANPTGIPLTGITFIDGDLVLGKVLSYSPTTSRITRYSGFSSSVKTYFQFSGGVHGIVWDGANFYRTYDGGIWKHTGFTASSFLWRSFSAPYNDQRDITIDNGGYLYSQDRNTDTSNRVWRINISSKSASAILGPGSYEGVAWIDQFNIYNITLQYKNAGSSFVNVASSAGDVGGGVTQGSHSAYWTSPFTDRGGVEIADERVSIDAVPDVANEGTNTVTVTNVEQLKVGDGTGNPGDVKVNYTIA